MKTEEDRIKWMEDQKISVHKLPEEIIERSRGTRTSRHF